MPSASQIKAGAAWVEMSLKDGAFTRGLAAAQRRLNNFAAGAKHIGATILTTGASLAGPAVLAARTYANFADKMSQVRAVTDANDEQFEQLKATAKDLGANTAFAASQAAEGMTYLGMAGFDTEKILAGIPHVLNLALAGSLDLGLAADIASDVGSAFGMTADEIGRVADVMAVTASNANTNIEMMGETLKYSAPLAAAAGQSIEDLSAAIGVLGNSGIKASMAGTDLAQIFKKMAEPAAQEALKKLGVATVDAEGNMRSIIAVMHDLRDATANMAEGEKLSTFATIFDRAAKSALILTSGTKGLDDLREKLNNSAGAAEKMAAVMEDNLAGSWRSFMSSVEALQIALGEAMQGPLRDVLATLTETARTIADLISQNRDLVVAALKIAGAMVLVGGALLTAGFAVQGIAFAFGGLAAIVSAAGTAIGIMGSIFAAILSPIGLATSAIAGIGGAILWTTGTGAEALAWLGGQLDRLRDIAGRAMAGIGDALATGNISQAAKILWLTLRMEWMRGVNALNALWDGFKHTMLSTATNAFYGAVKVLAGAWAGLRAAWVQTTAFMSSAWATFTAGIGTAWSNTQGFIERGIHRLMGLLDDNYNAEVAIEIAEVNRAADRQRIKQTRQQALAETEQQRRDDLAAIGSEFEATTAALDAQAEQANAARLAKYQAENDQAAEELAKAREEWQAAITEAAQARTTVETGDPETGIPPLSTFTQSIVDGVKAATETTTEVATSVRGTFDVVSNILGLQGNSDVQERTARAAEQTARNTRDIRRELQDNGLIFG